MSVQIPNTTRQRRLSVTVLVLCLLATALAIYRHSAAESAVPAPVGKAVLELASADVTTVVSGTMSDSLRISGTLEPIRQSVLTAEVEGRVDQVLVRTGEKVVAGQVLGIMNSRDLENRLAEQRANLAASRAQLALAEKVQKRNEELLAKNFISAISVDNSRSTLEANREAVKAHEAQLALAVQAVSKATIRTPIAGIIAERAVEPGQHVGLNTRLFAVIDLRELEFAASVSVGEIEAIRIGQGVNLTVEGSSSAFTGHVERIAPTADRGSRMIPVYVRVANLDESLKGGMVVQGRIKIDESASTLILSDQAIRREGNLPYVLVLVGKAGAQTVDRRDLRLGIVDESAGLVEVKSGLVAGDSVLLSRVAGVTPGSRVLLAGRP